MNIERLWIDEIFQSHNFDKGLIHNMMNIVILTLEHLISILHILDSFDLPKLTYFLNAILCNLLTEIVWFIYFYFVCAIADRISESEMTLTGLKLFALSITKILCSRVAASLEITVPSVAEFSQTRTGTVARKDS
jgi:hypothetical protein